MRAAVVERYGPPEAVQVREVAEPAVRRGRTIVRVASAAVSSGDARLRAGRFPAGFGPVARVAFGFRGPRRAVLGGSLSGVVVAADPADPAGPAVGQRVCAMNGTAMGAHAELVAVRTSRLVVVPDGVTHDDAAGVLFGGVTAHHFLHHPRVHVRPGDAVLVNGASGATGTNAVQLAALAGASVTGVCSGTNAPLVRDLGAAEVIDRLTHDLGDARGRFDVVVDTVGNLTIGSGRELLRPGGRLALVAASLGQTLRARGPVVAGPAAERPEVAAELVGLVDAGRLRVVIDRTVDLGDVAEAHRLVDGGRKVGNVLVHP